MSNPYFADRGTEAQGQWQTGQSQVCALQSGILPITLLASLPTTLPLLSQGSLPDISLGYTLTCLLELLIFCVCVEKKALPVV